MRVAPELLKRDINLFVFDFAGCGMSEGEYISLGYHEKNDVKIVVDFVEKLPGVGKIGLWGRSMGAATAMMYSQSDDRIKAICFDSPFSDFTKLARELCKKQVNLPNFLIDMALSFIKGSIKSRNELDIYELTPITYAPKTNTPGFFVHAMNDELIHLDHSLNLFEVYGGMH
jgi:dipeptidyl aminopeptidase/acylaminoacyl peptidase